MAETTSTKKRCMLLEIAPKLRNRIYNELFQDGSAAIDSTLHLPPLLKTCKQVRNEAIGMWYASTTFTYTHDAYPAEKYGSDVCRQTQRPLELWLKPLPDVQRAIIPNIHVRIVSKKSDEILMTIERVHGGEPEFRLFSRVFWQDRRMAKLLAALSGLGMEEVGVVWENPGLKEGWEWKPLQEVDGQEPDSGQAWTE